MRALLLACISLIFFAPAGQAQDTTAGPELVVTARQRLEATDSRATGRLVRVDGTGQRISDPVLIKAHWFPGVLRVLLVVTPAQTGSGKQRISILFEMRPKGKSEVRIFGVKQATPILLPPSQWSQGVLGSEFTYEDFLEPELYWPEQTELKEESLGSHLCRVLRSTPGVSDHSQYSHVETWFDTTTGYPLHVIKTLKMTNEKKEFTSLGLTQSAGVWAAKQVQVVTPGVPGASLLIFERGSARAHLTPKDFDPQQVSRAQDAR